MNLRRLNTVYVAVWWVAGVKLRQNRWTWSRARAERWAERLQTKYDLPAYVEETRLL